jgi:hypothetical protein
MALLQATLKWQNVMDGDEDYEEASQLLHHAVDEMDSETISELVRVVNGGVNLRSVS